jgi:hypothetical protein
MSIFGACAEPEAEMFGEKIVRVYKYGEKKLREKFNRGDVLVITPEVGFRGRDPYPKEGLVTDVGKDWINLGVGTSWPIGLFEMRKHVGRYLVRVDRTAPLAPLKAQRMALEKLRKGLAGDAAALLAGLFVEEGTDTSEKQYALRMSREVPKHYEVEGLESQIENAMEKAISKTSFTPNSSQKEAVIWALSRNIGLIRGPPGAGKTRVASLLISTALNMELKQPIETGKVIGNDEGDDVDVENDTRKSPRVLAVTHSNGAADVLLQALLQMNVPAGTSLIVHHVSYYLPLPYILFQSNLPSVRHGRPASVSPNVQHRTIVALAEKMPEVVNARRLASDVTLDSMIRQAALYESKQSLNDVQNMIARTAPVVVTSCISAQQLLTSIGEVEDGDGCNFDVVVLDEAGQTTEPGLVCALAASKACQLILIGDTRQLPPTVTTQNIELRNTIGVSPMERLLKIGCKEFTLREQYRMPPSLLQHPNQYFYNGLVKCAVNVDGGADPNQPPLKGFPWPNQAEPLAFVDVGTDRELSHNFGGKSNPTEVKVILDIVGKVLDAEEVRAENIAIITPYSKQVQLLRTELNSMPFQYGKTTEIRVGTVDSFQGSECDLVIFSAVRSNLLKELGFLRDERRLNVAITRAKRGLILVGDVTVLNTCRHWRALITSCSDRRCTLTEKDYYEQVGAKNKKEIRMSDLELDMDDEFFGLF